MPDRIWNYIFNSNWLVLKRPQPIAEEVYRINEAQVNLRKRDGGVHPQYMKIVPLPFFYLLADQLIMVTYVLQTEPQANCYGRKEIRFQMTGCQKRTLHPVKGWRELNQLHKTDKKGQPISFPKELDNGIENGKWKEHLGWRLAISVVQQELGGQSVCPRYCSYILVEMQSAQFCQGV